MFDAQCDFAAITYEADYDPDGLLLQFAEDLSRSGLMAEQNQHSCPVVYSFERHPSQDGATLAVEPTCFDKSVVRFAIPVDNIQHLIAFLLIWVHMISPEESNDGPAEGCESRHIPMAIGKTEGEHAYIGISVGRAELVFSLPASSLGSVSQLLLMAGAPLRATPS